MSKDKRGLGDVEFASKVKTQTFKQLQLERLIMDGTIVPASKLAQAKEFELQRVRDFEAAVADEERHRRSDRTKPEGLPHSLVTTREPFQE
jgi:hypothetical protein